MPVDYKLYHPKWFTVIRPAILQRADFKCETCGVPDHSYGFRDSSGRFYPLTSAVEDIIVPEIRKQIKIVLTIAHLDHDIGNNDYSNLKALCQRCHNRYDLLHRTQNRKFRKAQAPKK